MFKFKNPAINPEKPIIFLDCDGILNHERFYRNRIINKDLPHRFNQLDPESVKILNEISDWNFVLSSTWRIGKDGLKSTQEAMEYHGWKGKLIDETPRFSIDGMLRGNEIYMWMKANIENYSDFKNYIIFDDDSDMLLWQAENFIHVDRYHGITPNHIYRAKRKMRFDVGLEGI